MELRQRIQDLEQQGILEKVKQPTPWISNMVAVKKPNRLRIFLDLLYLNKGIRRNHYPIPTIDDIAPRLMKTKMFSVINAKDGFLQVMLDEPSSLLTTFWTPKEDGNGYTCRLEFSLRQLSSIRLTTQWFYLITAL